MLRILNIVHVHGDCVHAHVASNQVGQLVS